VDITYRRVEPGEADRLVAFLTGDTWPFHGFPLVTADLARQWIAAGRFHSHDSRAFWITVDGEDAGLIRLMDLGDRTPVFDLRLRAQWRGKGVGGQALRWLTAYLFGELPAIRRVQGTTRQDNRAMRRAFQRGRVRQGGALPGRVAGGWRRGLRRGRVRDIAARLACRNGDRSRLAR
jgi:RimJ/RimL family protein N-acetyltransferase